jgi:hypothetical protein
MDDATYLFVTDVSTRKILQEAHTTRCIAVRVENSSDYAKKI